MRPSRVAILMVGAFLCGILGLRPLLALFPSSRARQGRSPDFRKIIAEGKLENYIFAQNSGTDPTTVGVSIENPLVMVSAGGTSRFTRRGVDIKKLAAMKALLIQGEYCGANTVDFVNKDPNLLLVFGKGFVTHGHVYSLGPVLAAEGATFMGPVVTPSLVWFIQDSSAMGIAIGQPLVVSDTARGAVSEAITKEVWYGNYGLDDLGGASSVASSHNWKPPQTTALSPEDAWRRSVEPSRVTLHLEHATLAEAYRTLSEASGNPIKVYNLPPHKPIALSIENEPFWKAFDMIQRIQPASEIDSGNNTSLYITWPTSSTDETPLFTWVNCTGPAEVYLYSFRVVRKSEYNWKTNDPSLHTQGPTATIQIGVRIESRVMAVGGQIRLEELTDDTGKNLLASAATDHIGQGRLSVGPSWGYVYSRPIYIGQAVSIPVAVPNPTAKQLKSMRGTLELMIVPPSLAVPANVAQAQKASKSVQFPFEFKDVPLPPLVGLRSSGNPIPKTPTEATPLPSPLYKELALEQLAVSTVNLSGKDMAPQEVMDQIVKQTGNPVGLSRHVNAKALPRVTASWVNTPFWSAMEDFCWQTGLQGRMLYKERKWELLKESENSWQFLPGMRSSCGPVSAWLLPRVDEEIAMLYTSPVKVSDDVHVGMELATEPRYATSILKIPIEEYVTYDDRKLTGKPPDARVMSPETDKLNYRFPPGAAPVWLKSVRAYLRMEISTGSTGGVWPYAGFVEFHDVPIPPLPSAAE